MDHCDGSLRSSHWDGSLQWIVTAINSIVIGIIVTNDWRSIDHHSTASDRSTITASDEQSIDHHNELSIETVDRPSQRAMIDHHSERSIDHHSERSIDHYSGRPIDR
jgi:hypothetical protein